VGLNSLKKYPTAKNCPNIKGSEKCSLNETVNSTLVTSSLKLNKNMIHSLTKDKFNLNQPVAHNES
jgi:hypothetical protein